MSLRLDIDALRQAASLSEPGLLDGRAIKRALLERLAVATAQLRLSGIVPGLAVVQVGEDPASSVYVRNKIMACEQVGVRSELHHLPADVARGTFCALLDRLNHDPAVHGILIQLPLPAHLDPHGAIELIDPAKDVDGFHPVNLGQLMAGRGVLEPCTPRGIMTLLQAYDVSLRGVDALVIGRSMTVGRPMAQMLMRADATVTAAHRHSRDLAALVSRAELLVVAAGVPGLVRGEWIRQGAVVVDVGINRLADGRIVGDVEFEAARQRARAITPVPGGVGQLTVATLMENAIRAACRAHNTTVDLSINALSRTP